MPYSLHATFLELRAFVARLAPHAIRGIVKGSAAAAAGCAASGNQHGGGGQAVALAGGSQCAAACRAAQLGSLAGGRVPFSCLEPAVHFADLLGGGGGGLGHDGAITAHHAQAGAPAAAVAVPARLSSWQGLLQRSASACSLQRRRAGVTCGVGGGRSRPLPPAAAELWDTGGCRSDGGSTPGQADPDSGQQATEPVQQPAAKDALASCSAATEGQQMAEAPAQAAAGKRRAAGVVKLVCKRRLPARLRVMQSLQTEVQVLAALQ